MELKLNPRYTDDVWYNKVLKCKRCGKKFKSVTQMRYEPYDDLYYCLDCWAKYKEELYNSRHEDNEILMERMLELRREAASSEG